MMGYVEQKALKGYASCCIESIGSAATYVVQIFLIGDISWCDGTAVHRSAEAKGPCSSEAGQSIFLFIERATRNSSSLKAGHLHTLASTGSRPRKFHRAPHQLVRPCPAAFALFTTLPIDARVASHPRERLDSREE